MLPRPASFPAVLRERLDALRGQTPQALQTLYAALARQGYDTAAVQAFLWGGESPYLLGMVCAMGLALAACAWAGIASAFSARLNARLQQVGMLRALGATHRQIRRLFAREALWLFALCTPAAFALSCLAARLAVGALYVSGALVAAILLLAALGVLLSLQTPLRRAPQTGRLASKAVLASFAFVFILLFTDVELGGKR